MIVSFGIILYRLIMKFPFIVVLLYSVSFFSPFVSENEIEIVEKVEITEENTINLDDFFIKEFVENYPVYIKNYDLQDFKPGVYPRFIKTTYLKLYILHSSLMIDKFSFCY